MKGVRYRGVRTEYNGNDKNERKVKKGAYVKRYRGVR